MSKQDAIKAASKREQKKVRLHSAEREQARGKAIKMDGQVTEALGYENYRVELDRSTSGRSLPTGRENGVTILATLSGRIRQNHIRVMTGDRVEVELSPYDLTRGRISYRYNPKK